MPQNKHTENGNVFVIILIAVVLFGALIFTFSRSGSQGISSISKQEAKITAQEIINYARLVEGAVDRVRRNGCSESEINFENLIVTGYTNLTAPSDESCDIFSDNGGKISFSSATNKTTDGSYWLISPAIAIVNVGSDSATNECTEDRCTELNLFLGPLSTPICDALNSLLNAPNTTAESMTGYGSQFTGAYTNADQLGNTSTTYRNIHSACLNGNSDPTGLYFYHVLLAR